MHEDLILVKTFYSNIDIENIDMCMSILFILFLNVYTLFVLMGIYNRRINGLLVSSRSPLKLRLGYDICINYHYLIHIFCRCYL